MKNLNTLQGINISHLGKRKIIFKMPFLGDMLVPWRVIIFNLVLWWMSRDSRWKEIPRTFSFKTWCFKTSLESFSTGRNWSGVGWKPWLLLNHQVEKKQMTSTKWVVCQVHLRRIFFGQFNPLVCEFQVPYENPPKSLAKVKLFEVTSRIHPEYPLSLFQNSGEPPSCGYVKNLYEKW